MTADNSRNIQRLLLAATMTDLLLLGLVLYGFHSTGAIHGLGVGFVGGQSTSYQDAPSVVWVLLALLLVLLYQVVTELFFGGWTVGKAIFGLEARANGKSPLPLSLRTRRLGLRAMAISLWRESVDGIAAHDHLLGINYDTPLLEVQPGPPADRDWALRIQNGSRAGQRIQARSFWRFRKKGVVLVGRDPDWADLVLADEGVSRRHAILIAEGSKFQVIDRGSRNGTIVNQHRIPTDVKAECGNPSTIYFGSTGVEVIRHQIKKSKST